ncbi:MAG: bacteriophage holin [Candidatus Nanohaloarchaeota archaeon QJJ-9]|nr:bacteriophage holin [Candidatus Nanohaloarchaeota archaeon QJJ-9]
MAEKMKIDPASLGIGFGVCIGLYTFVLGLLAWQFQIGGEFVDLISTFYIGYKPTLVGSLVGGIYGAVDGIIGGVLIAWIYNKSVEKEVL